MKKPLLVVALVALLALSIVPAASAAGTVAGTFSIADLGQGAWGGGTLFDGGSASGNVAFSAYNGQLIFQIRPVSWSRLSPDFVEICFVTTAIKGTPFFPPNQCLPLPVTGGPVNVGGFIMRVNMK